jgi:hypothetical protein
VFVSVQKRGQMGNLNIPVGSKVRHQYRLDELTRNNGDRLDIGSPQFFDPVC